MALELIEAARWLRFDPKAGWPREFNHWQLAALQMDRAGKDVKALRTAQRDWERSIELAIDGGTLEHQSSTVKTMVRAAMTVKPPAGFVRNWGNRDDWPGRYTVGGVRYAYTQPAEYKDVTHHHITAPAFAVWLTAHGIEPSAHMAAWFKACGVGAMPQVVPGVEPVQPKTYSELVAFYKAQQTRWTEWPRWALALLLEEEVRRKAVIGATGVRKDMAADFCFSVTALGKHLQRAISGESTKPEIKAAKTAVAAGALRRA